MAMEVEMKRWDVRVMCEQEVIEFNEFGLSKRITTFLIWGNGLLTSQEHTFCGKS